MFLLTLSSNNDSECPYALRSAIPDSEALVKSKSLPSPGLLFGGLGCGFVSTNENSVKKDMHGDNWEGNLCDAIQMLSIFLEHSR